MSTLLDSFIVTQLTGDNCNRVYFDSIVVMIPEHLGAYLMHMEITFH